MWVTTVFPIVEQLRTYRREWLGRDVGAGFAVAAVAVPIGIAYPAIAGLPPEIGLYASIFGLIGYAVFGSSRQLIVGPDAATLTVLAASLYQLGLSSAQQWAVTAATFAILFGLLCLISAALRFGFIANFLSRPVLTGYLCGVSLSLLAGQIERLTKVQIHHGGFARPVGELLSQWHMIHWPTATFGLGLFLLLRLLRWQWPRAPGPLVALALATLLGWAFDLQAQGIVLVGTIPAGMPSPTLPIPHGVEFDDLVLSALGILVVGFGSGIVTARSFGAKNRYRVDANRELIGFGAANIASGLFGGFPVTGADSRTAVNDAVGGRTQLAGIIAALALVMALAAFSDVLQLIPIAALGAVLASAAIDLLDLRAFRYLWKTARPEFFFALIATAGVIDLGVLKGVLIAIGATAVYLLARVSYPRDALLGRIPGREGLHKLHREPRAKPISGLTLYLIESGLIFFNIDYVRDRIRWIVDRHPPETRWFILDGEAMTTVDSTAAATLEEIRADLERRNLKFGISNLYAQPRGLLNRSGFLAKLGPDMVFENIEDAVAAFEREERKAAAVA